MKEDTHHGRKRVLILYQTGSSLREVAELIKAGVELNEIDCDIFTLEEPFGKKEKRDRDDKKFTVFKRMKNLDDYDGILVGCYSAISNVSHSVLHFFDQINEKNNNKFLKYKMGSAFCISSSSSFGLSDTLDAITKSMTYFKMVLPTFGAIHRGHCINPKGLAIYKEEKKSLDESEIKNFGTTFAKFLDHLSIKTKGKEKEKERVSRSSSESEVEPEKEKPKREEKHKKKEKEEERERKLSKKEKRNKEKKKEEPLEEEFLEKKEKHKRKEEDDLDKKRPKKEKKLDVIETEEIEEMKLTKEKRRLSNLEGRPEEVKEGSNRDTTSE